MAASAVYHQFCCMGPQYYIELLRVDLIGISIMIFGLMISSVYVCMHEHPELR